MQTRGDKGEGSGICAANLILSANPSFHCWWFNLVEMDERTTIIVFVGWGSNAAEDWREHDRCCATEGLGYGKSKAEMDKLDWAPLRYKYEAESPPRTLLPVV